MSEQDKKDGASRIPAAKKPASRAKQEAAPELKEADPTTGQDDVVHRLHQESSSSRKPEPGAKRFQKSGAPFDHGHASGLAGPEEQASIHSASLPDMAALEESRWGNERTSGSSWTMIGAIVITLAVLALVSVRECGQDSASKTRVSSADQLLTPAGDDNDVDEWFEKHVGTLPDRIADVLNAFFVAENDEARSKVVRFPELFLERSKSHRAMAKPRLQDDSGRSIRIKQIGDTSYVVYECKDEDFLPFRAYLTRDGEDLKLDWSATVAWSSMNFDDLRKKPISGGPEYSGSDTASQDSPGLAEPVLLRCMLSRRNGFYAGPYNDEDYSVFMLLSPDKTQNIWGYTQRNSPLDIELRKMLDHGLFVIELKKDLRVTVRITHGVSDALPSQFELVELVHSEWVHP